MAIGDFSEPDGRGARGLPGAFGGTLATRAVSTFEWRRIPVAHLRGCEYIPGTAAAHAKTPIKVGVRNVNSGLIHKL